MSFFSDIPFKNAADHITANARNHSLSVINGSINLTNGHWKDILINGNAVFGSEDSQSIFEGIVVVNGNAKVKSATFNILEVNGNLDIRGGSISQILEVFGNAELFSLDAQALVLKGKKFHIKDCTIHGDVIWQGMGSNNNKLILDNSTIVGKLIYQKDRCSIESINNSKFN